MYVCEYMCVCIWRAEEGSDRSSGARVTVLVSYLMWGLGTEPGPSTRESGVHNS